MLVILWYKFLAIEISAFYGKSLNKDFLYMQEDPLQDSEAFLCCCEDTASTSLCCYQQEVPPWCHLQSNQEVEGLLSFLQTLWTASISVSLPECFLPHLSEMYM